MLITIPGLRLESEANRRDKWNAVKRTANARKVVGEALRIARIPRERQPSIVTIVRVAPGKLDDDNIAASAKSVRDSVATWIAPKANKRGDLSGDDSCDGPITFRYAQRYGGVRVYGCDLIVEPRVDSPLAVKTHSGGEARADVLGEYAVIELWDREANEGAFEMFTPQQLRALIVQCEKALREIER